MEIAYTLLGDGTSDRLLMYVIDWALRAEGAVISSRDWADLTLVSPKPQGLAQRVTKAFELYPCDILFVHRDAEREDPVARRREIDESTSALEINHVAVIPVRMTEAWLLHDESAIRKACGNPRGTVNLNIPNIRQLEAEADPKDRLLNALLTATELNGRRLKQRQSEKWRMRERVAELIDDFSQLNALQSFSTFRRDLSNVLNNVRASRMHG